LSIIQDIKVQNTRCPADLAKLPGLGWVGRAGADRAEMTRRLGGLPVHRSALLMAVAVLVAGLGLSVIAAHLVDVSRQGTAKQGMERRATTARDAVTVETTRYVNAVEDVAASLGAQADLRTADFQDITAPLADQRLHGAVGIGFVVPATDDRIAATQTYWRGQGAEDLLLRPVGTGRVHLFDVFGRSLDGAPRMRPGLDLSQLAAPSLALQEARRAGVVAVSSTYLLLGDRGLPSDRQHLAFILAAPVYGPNGADGYRPFRGWVLMGLRGQDFIEETLRSTTQGQMDATLAAPSDSGDQIPVAQLTAAHHPDLYQSIQITVAQQRWTLDLAADSTALPGGSHSTADLTRWAGTAITVLLTLLVYVLASTRALAVARVATATAQLRDRERDARGQALLLTEIMNNISEAVIVVDSTGQVVHHNPAAAPIVTVGGEVLDLPAWHARRTIRRLDGTGYEPADLPWERAARHGAAVDREEVTVDDSGPLSGSILSVCARPFPVDAGQTGAVAVLRDITARKNHELALTQAADLLREELVAREAVEARLVEQSDDLNAFAAVVAHDLKTPLTAVAGFAEILRDELDDRDDVHLTEIERDSLERITKGVDRMRRLIDDLLHYATARDGAFRSESIDLECLVDQIVTERTAHLRARAGGGAQQALFPDIYIGPLPVVQADPAMVRQLLDNLIGNALKYTLPGQPGRVDIAARQDLDGYVRIDIADRGIGIPRDQHDRIFETFHRAHAAGTYQGTGLGLAICQRIVHRHGGRIGVEDNPGGGSRFHVTLPRQSLVPAKPVAVG
jgi:signal transduction histidine kinase